MGWSDLDKGAEASEETQKQREDAYRVLATSAAQAVGAKGQEPFKKFLLTKAHGVSYRPGAQPAEVAFDEGQRSLALQILKLSGEI